MKPPPPPTGLTLAVALLRGPARIVHRVVPKRERQEEDAHEEEQGEDFHEQREEHHRAAARLPEGEQLGGSAWDVQRDEEEAHHGEQEDRGLLRLAVVELTQSGYGRQPRCQLHASVSARSRHPLPLWGRVGWGLRQDRDRLGFNHWPLLPLTLEHAVTVVGDEQQRAQGPDQDEEKVPGARVASDIEQLDQRRRHQPPALCALVTSSRFSATITSAVKPNRMTKASTVPMMFFNCWRLMATSRIAPTCESSGPAG